MKKIVGIVPYANLFKDENIYHNEYIFGNNYMNRINECGGLASGILPADGYIDEENLQMYDCFVITGGDKTAPYHLQVIDYALKADKPLLGVCLGMQSLYIYFALKEEKENTNYTGTILDLFEDKLKNGKDNFLDSVDGHMKLKEVTKDNLDLSKHFITLDKSSVLYEIYKKERINMISLHRFKIKPNNYYLKVTGVANDGTIEAVEYNKKTLGVQFHPENEKENDILFKYIIEQCN